MVYINSKNIRTVKGFFRTKISRIHTIVKAKCSSAKILTVKLITKSGD